MKQEKQLTPDELYKKNQKKSKLFKRFAPVMFWAFMTLTILFVVLTIKNSFGNITEIISLLDKDVYNGQQLEQNYIYLIGKYGEWQFGTQGGSFSIQFVNLASALFSGLMIIFLVLSIVCLSIAVIVGKIIFPKLATYYSENNQDMVNMATLQTNAEINKKRKNKEEWF